MAAHGSCITLASYNMHKAVGLDGRRDPHRVLKVLQEIDADIVALQEADKRMGGRGSTVPHELIDSHGLYKAVHLGVRHKRMFDKARRHTDRLIRDLRRTGKERDRDEIVIVDARVAEVAIIRRLLRDVLWRQALH